MEDKIEERWNVKVNTGMITCGVTKVCERRDNQGGGMRVG